LVSPRAGGAAKNASARKNDPRTRNEQLIFIETNAINVSQWRQYAIQFGWETLGGKNLPRPEVNTRLPVAGRLSAWARANV
jgi:hypothetical protein